MDQNIENNTDISIPQSPQAQPNIAQEPINQTPPQTFTLPTSPSPKNNQWLLFILLSLLIIALGTTSYFAYQNIQLKKSPTQPIQTLPTTSITEVSLPPQQLQPVNINESPLVYEKDGKIFLLNTLNDQAIQIDEGNSPSLSTNQEYIAYIKMDIDDNLHIYKRSTKAKTSLPTTDEWRLRGIQWSPDDKYLLTDSGTSIQGGRSLYAFPSGKKVTAFSSIGNKTMWIDDTKFVYLDPQPLSIERPSETGGGSNISKISTLDGIKQILAQATNIEDYNLLEIENNIIYFSKSTVANNSDWGTPGKEIITYWQMNNDGSGKLEISQPQTLRDKIKSFLPPQYSNYEYYSLDFNNTQPNWVVFSLNKGGSVYDSLICVSDINNPQTSFKEIATGAYPSW